MRALLVLLAAALLTPPPAHAQASDVPAAADASGWLQRVKDNPLGSFYLKLRARYEHADAEGQQRANAATLRSVLGFGTRPWQGLSLLAEGEAVVALDDHGYFDGTGSPSRRTTVADPEDLNLNQLYLHYDLPEWGALRVGRQRLTFDDRRFVGNVGWRQNEQTLDAAFASTGLGIEHLKLGYAYVEDVRRIFADKSPAARRDFESKSNLLHLDYTRFPEAELALFAYLLDFRNAPASSSNTYGLRIRGVRELGSDTSLAYALSYAHQTDGTGHPIDYDASYVWVDGALRHEALGAAGLGYELLGSDGGKAGVGTPLATAHAFNGFADVFLDNGGRNGLQDFSAFLAPKLPGSLKGRLTFHWFESARRVNSALGWEFDAVLSKPVHRYVTLLLKAAMFEGHGSAGRPDVLRLWAQVSVDL